MAIVLIGFMGAGKSTVARELAQALDGEPHDSDALLEAQLGHPLAEEFERNGEAAFRAREEALVCELLARAGEDAVVALGGGSVLSERVREALRAHTTVLLDVDAPTAWERVRDGGGDERPLARDRDAFFALHREREALYADLADAVLVDLPAGGAARAAGALGLLDVVADGTRLLWASAASGSYPVLVGSGLLARGEVGAIVGALAGTSRSRSFLVADRTALALHGGGLGEAAALTIEVAPGEASKSLEQAQRIWQALAAGGMTRADHVLALGGGVVGDLAGFCAGAYQRGVPVVHVPTTLVAQVDSAYGGKTGVDLPQAKNYVGVYHQPAAVIVDPAALATLPAAELAAGWVEVLKTALIAGGALWEAVRAGDGAEVDERTILACARTKLAVVAADERDGGRRQVLNLGHTVGHGIETATGYGRYRHGEAVGLGLLAALRLSGRDELREEVAGMLAARALPTRMDGVEVEAVMEAIGKDKKRLGERVPFVLVRAVGDVAHGCEVDAGDVRAAVAELTA